MKERPIISERAVMAHYQTTVIAQPGRVAEPLILNFGCPVLRFRKGGGLVVFPSRKPSDRPLLPNPKNCPYRKLRLHHPVK